MALEAPVITWRDKEDKIDWPEGGRWDLGVLDASYETTKKWGALLWNNKGNKTDDAPNMQDITLSTFDTSGGTASPIVTHKVVRVKNVTMGETNRTPIGGAEGKHIMTNKSTVFEGVTSTPGTAPHIAGEGHTVDLLGVKNDGTKANSGGNFIELEFDALPPALAPSGKFDFMIRASYWM